MSQAHLSEIHKLKETLKDENEELKQTKQQLRDLQDKIKYEQEGSKVQTTLLQGNTELRERIQADERERLERENAAILKEKLDSLKLEIEQEKAEVKVLHAHRCARTHTHIVRRLSFCLLMLSQLIRFNPSLL